jgi:hypothetical protein
MMLFSKKNRNVSFSLKNMLLVNFCSMNSCVVTCIIIDTGNTSMENKVQNRNLNIFKRI